MDREARYSQLLRKERARQQNVERLSQRKALLIAEQRRRDEIAKETEAHVLAERHRKGAAFALREYKIQRSNFQQSKESLQGIPARAAPLLAASLLLLGFDLDYLGRLSDGRFAVWAFFLSCASVIAAGLSVLYSILAITDASPILHLPRFYDEELDKTIVAHKLLDGVDAVLSTTMEEIEVRVRQGVTRRSDLGAEADALIYHAQQMADWASDLKERTLDAVAKLTVSGFGFGFLCLFVVFGYFLNVGGSGYTKKDLAIAQQLADIEVDLASKSARKASKAQQSAEDAAKSAQQTLTVNRLLSKQNDTMRKELARLGVKM